MAKANKEQLEAHQETLNKNNDQHIKSLSKEDQKKFKAVTKALSILSEANCAAFLFPMVKTPYYDLETFVNYNNFQDVFNDDSAFYDEEKMGYPWHKLMSTLIDLGLKKYKLGTTPSEINTLFKFIYKDAYFAQKKLKEGEKP